MHDFFKDLDGQDDNEFTSGVGGLFESLSPKRLSKGPKRGSESASEVSSRFAFSAASDDAQSGDGTAGAGEELSATMQEMKTATGPPFPNLGSSDGTYWGTYNYTSAAAEEARHADVLEHGGEAQGHVQQDYHQQGANIQTAGHDQAPALKDLDDRISVAERRLEGVRSGVEDSVHAARASIRVNEMRTAKLVKRLHTEIESLKKRLRSKDADLSRVRRLSRNTNIIHTR